MIYFIAFLLFNLCGKCVCLGFVLCSNYHFYLEESSNRLTNVEFGQGGVINCKDYGEVNSFQAFYIKLPHHCVTTVDVDGLNSVMRLCPKIEKDRLISSLIFDRLPRFRPNIFPGTNWCGAGNIARSDDDVGFLRKLDSCCKTHDHCPEGIAVGETKYGIENKQLGTISRCDCDDEFYQCLKNVSHASSDNVGFLFFNVLAMPCFKKDYPIIKCIEKGGLANSQCQKYEQDTNAEPTIQLFDSKVYKPTGLTGIATKFFL